MVPLRMRASTWPPRVPPSEKVCIRRASPGALHLHEGTSMKSRKSAAETGSMVVRAPADVVEVLDRVLDRGIVIDAWLRVSVIGLALVDVDARVVVASIRTYVRDGDALA